MTSLIEETVVAAIAASGYPHRPSGGRAPITAAPTPGSHRIQAPRRQDHPARRMEQLGCGASFNHFVLLLDRN